jgi:hypothetical protein
MSNTAEFGFEGMGPSELASALESLAPALNSELEAAARDIGQRIRGDAADNAPVDTGQLASSIEAVVESVGSTITEIRVGTNRDGAAAQEYGTDPFFPPPSELRDWARRVLGDPDAAFAVAQSISETGISEKRYLRDAFEENLEYVVDRINEAVEAAFAEVGFT